MSGYFAPALTSEELSRMVLATPSCPRCGDLFYRHISMPTATGKALACPTSFGGNVAAAATPPRVEEVPTR